MTEKEFKNAFEGTDWKVAYKNNEKCAYVLLKLGRTEIIVGSTISDSHTRSDYLRRMAFRNAASDLGGAVRQDSRYWTYPAWYIDGKLHKAPGWYMDSNVNRPYVRSVEEFVFKLSVFYDI